MFLVQPPPPNIIVDRAMIAVATVYSAFTDILRKTSGSPSQKQQQEAYTDLHLDPVLASCDSKWL